MLFRKPGMTLFAETKNQFVEVLQMFNKITNSPALLSLLMIVFGIILVVWPSPVLSAVISLLGVGLIVGGVIAAVGWYKTRESTVLSYSRLGSGLIAIVAGAIILFHPLEVASFFPIAIGIVILVTGLINMVQALDLRKAGYPRWLVSFILSIVTIACGIVFVTQPISALEIPVIAAGIILIYDGVSSLWISTRLSGQA